MRRGKILEVLEGSEQRRTGLRRQRLLAVGIDHHGRVWVRPARLNRRSTRRRRRVRVRGVLGLAVGLVEGQRPPALTYATFCRSGALVLAGRYMEVRQLRDIIDVPEIIQRVLRKVRNCDQSEDVRWRLPTKQ